MNGQTGMHVIVKTLILFVIGLFSWNIACAAAPDVGGIVLVGTMADVSGNRLRTGFVADDKGHVIAHIGKTREVLLVKTMDGTIHTAQMVDYDDINDLALLKMTTGIENLKPYDFAHDPAKLQRRVFGIKVQEDSAQNQVIAGTLASMSERESDIRPGYYRHNALVGEAGEGGPLFNNCGEVVGVIVPQPEWLASFFGGTEDDVSAYAVPIEWLAGRFGAQGLLPIRATDVCLSESDQAAARELRAAEAVQEAQARLEEEANRVADATQKAATAQAELDAVKSELEQTQGASEEERRRLEAEIEARRQAVDEARAQQNTAQEQYEATLRAAQEREEQYKKWVLLGATLLVLLLLLVWVLKQRAITRERREKAAAQSRAEKAQASLAVREEDAARTRRTPTVFLDGMDSDGQSVALRIPSASIAASGGAVVGRNPSDSDFVINHPNISRRHFRLFTGEISATDDQSIDQFYPLVIEDLGSTNGIIVDGKKLASKQETILVDRCYVELGDLKLSVRLEQG